MGYRISLLDLEKFATAVAPPADVGKIKASLADANAREQEARLALGKVLELRRLLSGDPSLSTPAGITLKELDNALAPYLSWESVQAQLNSAAKTYSNASPASPNLSPELQASLTLLQSKYTQARTKWFAEYPQLTEKLNALSDRVSRHWSAAVPSLENRFHQHTEIPDEIIIGKGDFQIVWAITSIDQQDAAGTPLVSAEAFLQNSKFPEATIVPKPSATLQDPTSTTPPVGNLTTPNHAVARIHLGLRIVAARLKPTPPSYILTPIPSIANISLDRTAFTAALRTCGWPNWLEITSCQPRLIDSSSLAVDGQVAVKFSILSQPIELQVPFSLDLSATALADSSLPIKLLAEVRRICDDVAKKHDSHFPQNIGLVSVRSLSFSASSPTAQTTFKAGIRVHLGNQTIDLDQDLQLQKGNLTLLPIPLPVALQSTSTDLVRTLLIQSTGGFAPAIRDIIQDQFAISGFTLDLQAGNISGTWQILGNFWQQIDASSPPTGKFEITSSGSKIFGLEEAASRLLVQSAKATEALVQRKAAAILESNIPDLVGKSISLGGVTLTIQRDTNGLWRLESSALSISHVNVKVRVDKNLGFDFSKSIITGGAAALLPCLGSFQDLSVTNAQPFQDGFRMSVALNIPQLSSTPVPLGEIILTPNKVSVAARDEMLSQLKTLVADGLRRALGSSIQISAVGPVTDLSLDTPSFDNDKITLNLTGKVPIESLGFSLPFKCRLLPYFDITTNASDLQGPLISALSNLSAFTKILPDTINVTSNPYTILANLRFKLAESDIFPEITLPIRLSAQGLSLPPSLVIPLGANIPIPTGFVVVKPTIEIPLSLSDSNAKICLSGDLTLGEPNSGNASVELVHVRANISSSPKEFIRGNFDLDGRLFVVKLPLLSMQGSFIPFVGRAHLSATTEGLLDKILSGAVACDIDTSRGTFSQDGSIGIYGFNIAKGNLKISIPEQKIHADGKLAVPLATISAAFEFPLDFKKFEIKANADVSLGPFGEIGFAIYANPDIVRLSCNVLFVDIMIVAPSFTSLTPGYVLDQISSALDLDITSLFKMLADRKIAIGIQKSDGSADLPPESYTPRDPEPNSQASSLKRGLSVPPPSFVQPIPSAGQPIPPPSNIPTGEDTFSSSEDNTNIGEAPPGDLANEVHMIGGYIGQTTFQPAGNAFRILYNNQPNEKFVSAKTRNWALLKDSRCISLFNVGPFNQSFLILRPDGKFILGPASDTSAAARDPVLLTIPPDLARFYNWSQIYDALVAGKQTFDPSISGAFSFVSGFASDILRSPYFSPQVSTISSFHFPLTSSQAEGRCFFVGDQWIMLVSRSEPEPSIQCIAVPPNDPLLNTVGVSPNSPQPKYPKLLGQILNLARPPNFYLNLHFISFLPDRSEFFLDATGRVYAVHREGERLKEGDFKSCPENGGPVIFAFPNDSKNAFGDVVDRILFDPSPLKSSVFYNFQFGQKELRILAEFDELEGKSSIALYRVIPKEGSYTSVLEGRLLLPDLIKNWQEWKQNGSFNGEAANINADASPDSVKWLTTQLMNPIPDSEIWKANPLGLLLKN